MKKGISILLVLLVTTFIYAQQKEQVNVQQLLQSKNFIFEAESVTPQRGRYRVLTSQYDLVVTSDTVVAFLPYFGRAYSAPVNSSEGGIKFTATEFDYTLMKGKKQSWDITIKPKNVPDIQDLFLNVFENGRASLHVNSINRESILFNGYIKEGKQTDKKTQQNQD